MNDSKQRKICLTLIVINAIFAFLLCGMPKYYKNENNLTHKTIAKYSDGSRIFISQTDVVLKDKDGKDFPVQKGSKIVRMDEVYESVTRELDGIKDENVIPVSVRAESYSDAYVMRSDLEDPAKFKEITEQVMKEQNDRIAKEREEGHKEYCLYVLKQRFWFVVFPLYPLHCLVGLIAFFVSRKIMKVIYGSGKLADTIAVTVLLIVVKIVAIIYFDLRPFLDYSPFGTIPLPSMADIFRTLFG